MSIPQLRFAAFKARWTKLRGRRDGLHGVRPARALAFTEVLYVEDRGEAPAYGKGVRRERHYLARYVAGNVSICWFEILWWEESQAVCGSIASSPEVWDLLQIPVLEYQLLMP